jgi:PilZ domain
MPEPTPAPPATVAACGVRCLICGRTNDCTTSQFLRYNREGFPWCCGEAMSARPTEGSKDEGLGVEKRICLRHPALPRAQLEFRRGVSGLGPNLGVELVDASEDGLTVHIKESVAVGDEVEVAVGRPLGGKLHKRRARVRWCRAAWKSGFLVEVVLTRRLSVVELNEVAQ